ncbi:hypothetical protein BH10ACT7_BH10ACT7_12910 [soil metagenome]
MTCTNCGTELPAGAMFCGECGRAVGAPSAAASGRAKPKSPAPPSPKTKPIPVVEDLVEPSSRPAEPPEVEPERRVSAQSVRSGLPVPPVPSVVVVAPIDAIPIEANEPVADLSIERCAQCGSILEPSDIFCGECGFVRQNASAAPRPNDTVAFDPFPWGLPRSKEGTPQSEPGVADLVILEPVTPEPVTGESFSHEPAPAPASSVPDRALDDEPDIDATRIVDRAATGERFVLQFSTGESVSVTGTGLLGRNPVAEPGEYFDLLLPISDPGKSVSKTHLEFGQEAGAFWVSDRFSGNGTVIREPERQSRRCDPGKRYRLLRGTRVDIGEQFFIVS